MMMSKCQSVSLSKSFSPIGALARSHGREPVGNGGRRRDKPRRGDTLHAGCDDARPVPLVSTGSPVARAQACLVTSVRWVWAIKVALHGHEHAAREER